MCPVNIDTTARQEERRKLWEEFCNDQLTVSIMRITPDEMAKLHNIFLMSSWREKSEILGALRVIRGRR